MHLPNTHAYTHSHAPPTNTHTAARPSSVQKEFYSRENVKCHLCTPVETQLKPLSFDSVLTKTTLLQHEA